MKIELDSGTVLNVKNEIIVGRYGSKTLCDLMIDSSGTSEIENISEDLSFPVHGIEDQIMSFILVYMNYRHANPLPEPENEREAKRTDNLNDWDLHFFQSKPQEIREAIISGSNYLNVSELTNLGARFLAGIIKTFTSPQQLRDFFRLENDFTPEEEERVRRESEWCEDK